MSTRAQFGAFLNARGLTGAAAEVGTHRGEFARMLLDGWMGETLFCVDPWADDLPGYAEQARLLWGGASTRSQDMSEAAALLAPHAGRFDLMRTTSLDATWRLRRSSKPGCLDFVFVDGDHRYEHVVRDLNEWWELLRPGGVMAGHDFVQPGEDHSWAAEVQRAVLEFSRDKRVDVWLLVEENGLPWSYHMEKPR
jgi:hypothetical protein